LATQPKTCTVSNRRGEAQQAQGTNMSKDDIKFETFVYAMVRRMTDVVKQIFKQHLIMKGIWNHYEMKDSDFDIVPVPPSYFAYMKNSEMLEAQFTKFSAFAQNINTDKAVFAKRTALKEGLGWSDEKINLNNKWLDEEMGVGEEKPEDGEVPGGADLGGLGGAPGETPPLGPEQGSEPPPQGGEAPPAPSGGAEDEIKI
jgi:hypothetical protein